MFEGHVVTSVDRTSLDFQFEDFWSNLPFKIIFTVLLTNHPYLELEDLS